MPQLQALYEKYRSQGLEMVGIQIMPAQNNLVADLRKTKGYAFQILFVPTSSWDQRRSYAFAHFDVAGAPTTLLLNSERKILFRHPGVVAAGDLEAEIRTLLGMEAFPSEGDGSDADRRGGPVDGTSPVAVGGVAY